MLDREFEQWVEIEYGNPFCYAEDTMRDTLDEEHKFIALSRLGSGFCEAEIAACWFASSTNGVASSSVSLSASSVSKQNMDKSSTQKPQVYSTSDTNQKSNDAGT